MNKESSRGSGVHGQIHACILSGEWAPGEKLKPAALAERYNTSTTVVREALTRLAGEKFVVMEPNRGFFVPELSLSELRDITEVRCRVEAWALELAVDRGDLTWESALMAAHHQLAKTPRRNAEDPTHVTEAWADAHREFHRKLIEPCGFPVLMDLSQQLHDTTELYRRWAAPSTAAAHRDVEAEHKEILDAVVARDAVLAAELLRKHYEFTMEVVLSSGLIEGINTPAQTAQTA
ncbi:MAG: GntR-family transcriptional regulator [Subtercola sp.]|jgi:DNA-binding GntR family transcriptional regulator|nr:GntR-family transcriptional regulator [Subtercola sp.]